jgi:hypothetical protein
MNFATIWNGLKSTLFDSISYQSASYLQMHLDIYFFKFDENEKFLIKWSLSIRNKRNYTKAYYKIFQIL